MPFVNSQTTLPCLFHNSPRFVRSQLATPDWSQLAINSLASHSVLPYTSFCGRAVFGSNMHIDDIIETIVCREWERLIHKKEITKLAEIKDDFAINLMKTYQYRNAIKDKGFQTGWEMNLPTYIYSKRRVLPCYGVEYHRFPQFFLRKVPQLPRMCMWAPIQRNVIIDEDPILHHIPYIGDEVVTDENWQTDLLDIYDNKVHLAADDFFTDDVLADLVDLLISKDWDEERDKYISLRSQTRPAEPIRIDKDLAFEIIADIYYGDITPEEIKEKYDAYQLTKKKESVYRETIPNIDGVQAVVYAREKALNSFQTLFCRRCFLYDCIAHNFYPPIYKPEEEDFSYTEPCGKDCFLNIDSVRSEEFIINAGKPNSNEETASTEYPKLPFDSIQTDCWTFSQKTLFNVLVRTYQCNFCSISRIFGNITCAEVYVYYQSLKLEEKEAIKTLINNDKDLVAKNKKKKYMKGKATSIWSKHIQKFKENSAAPDEDKVQTLYKPCDHDGFPCSESNRKKCECYKRGTFCEKICNCNPNCENRFPGCNCRGACITKSCPCHNAARECDPDLCKTCGAAELDLLERRDKYKCTNVSMQRGLHKHLLLGPSEVSGWGVFLNGTANKDELISEYCGETITQEEADRRGKVYDKHKSSFLFNLNSEQVVDAKRKGNKIRFANHSVNANCKASVKMVNGDFRIGIFANRNIDKYEELFFDYRYGPNDRLNFVCIERPNVK